MSDSPIRAPKEEQKICVICGFCCDGTLFQHAHLNPGERGHLPEKIEERSFTEDGKDYFRLPCLYFNKKCSIYDKKRADVCSAYRCQLLKNFADGKITLEDSLGIVRDAMTMRNELIGQFRSITGNSSQVTFRQVLNELVKITKSASDDKPVGPEYDLLLMRCNILEALLIKHIRSADDFGKMIIQE